MGPAAEPGSPGHRRSAVDLARALVKQLLPRGGPGRAFGLLMLLA